jgi:hypothetical protein
MASSVNSKLLDKFNEALNDRRFNPRLLGAHIALDGGAEHNQQFFQVVVGYLQATSQDYVYGTTHITENGMSQVAYEMLEVVKKYTGGIS